MLAVDTNVIVRYLLNDDPVQSIAAKAVVRQGRVFVVTTVLLETEWVLRSAYRCGPTQVASAFRAFVGLPGITVEDAGAVAQALDWMEHGMDFADALHLAQATGCDEFLTFDRDLAESANALDGVSVRVP